MRIRLIVIVSILLAAVTLGWSLRREEPSTVTIDQQTLVREAAQAPEPAPAPSPSDATRGAVDSDNPVDVAARARFHEQAREFFAQAPALPPEEARRRADVLSQELSRIEQAGGLSAGEIFLLRAGLIRATEPDERQQMAQLRTLKERYEMNSRGRQAAAQADPMFQLYKVRESQVVAEVMSLQTIPEGLSREEYLRRRLQAEREQLLGESM